MEDVETGVLEAQRLYHFAGKANGDASESMVGVLLLDLLDGNLPKVREPADTASIGPACWRAKPYAGG